MTVYTCLCGLMHYLRPPNRRIRGGQYCCDVCLCGRKITADERQGYGANCGGDRGGLRR